MGRPKRKKGEGGGGKRLFGFYAQEGEEKSKKGSGFKKRGIGFYASSFPFFFFSNPFFLLPFWAGGEGGGEGGAIERPRQPQSIPNSLGSRKTGGRDFLNIRRDFPRTFTFKNVFSLLRSIFNSTEVSMVVLLILD